MVGFSSMYVQQCDRMLAAFNVISEVRDFILFLCPYLWNLIRTHYEER